VRLLERNKIGDISDETKSTAITAFAELVHKEIEPTRMRRDFYHYLSWKIQSAGLPQKIVKKYNNFMICKFTTASWKSIEIFVGKAVTIFNRYHSNQSTSLLRTLHTLLQWWELEYEQFLWENRKRKYYLDLEYFITCTGVFFATLHDHMTKCINLDTRDILKKYLSEQMIWFLR
jgi:hypothetical protein